MIDPSRRDDQRGDLAKARHTSGWGHVPGRQSFHSELAAAANAFVHAVKRRVLAIDWIVRVTHKLLRRWPLIAPQLAVAEGDLRQ